MKSLENTNTYDPTMNSAEFTKNLHLASVNLLPEAEDTVDTVELPQQPEVEPKKQSLLSKLGEKAMGWLKEDPEHAAMRQAHIKEKQDAREAQAAYALSPEEINQVNAIVDELGVAQGIIAEWGEVLNTSAYHELRANAQATVLAAR